jgi:hypothetical protein
MNGSEGSPLGSFTPREPTADIPAIPLLPIIQERLCVRLSEDSHSHHLGTVAVHRPG